MRRPHAPDCLLGDAQRVLNARIGKVITGTSTLQEAVRSGVRAMHEAGITGFVDHGGHQWSAEAYVRMDVKTTCSNAANQAVMTRNEQYGNDLIWVNTNATARPGCYPWQGKVISMANRARVVMDGDGRQVQAYAVSQTTYGQPDGIYGINCHHGPMNVFIPGMSVVRGQEGAPSKDASDQIYQLTQKQRRMERQVRYAKREAAMLDAAGDKEGFEKAALKVKDRQAKLKAFVNEHEESLVLRGDRTQVLGYNRSVSAKAASAAKRAEARKNYLKNVKPALPKVAKADNSALAETLEVRTGLVNGVIPKGAVLENVRVIAGYRTSAVLKDAKRLSTIYGGDEHLWDKLTGTVQTDAFVYEAHWYENNGTQYEPKVKEVKKK